MKTKMQVAKTVTLKHANTEIEVYRLPEEIRNEIDTLDRMRQDYMDLAYKLEVMELAIKAKMSQINTYIENPSTT